MGRVIEEKAEVPVAYFVMGICGSGKSTIAIRIAEAKGIEILDADDFHPQSNVDKMSSGIPLTDEDRAGWLQTLNGVLSERLAKGESVVLACSALKQRYRDALGEGLSRVSWLYLKGDRETILERVGNRQDHFMPTTLVDSQLEALEEPTDAVVVDIRLPIDEIVSTALEQL
ncbi:gluconokinase [Pelagicoccus mobilis]|uniref:Gluconokinase n=1 Tax=Pelagicoccus mobilis TaxID=415221 RepID=A0A934S085_9BACT|nr:gluconokinase [Pelagicoccus mobilis]MBK1879538.1 gluconokinase [Pelagicoccus mobilis]